MSPFQACKFCSTGWSFVRFGSGSLGIIFIFPIWGKAAIDGGIAYTHRFFVG